MTDNEIIKALECNILNAKSMDCKIWSIEVYKLEYALDLINRQKAELSKKDTEIDILIRKKEALRDEISELKAEAQMADGYADALEQKAKSEAIKEFAERLKAKVENIPWCEYHLIHTEINNLVKEMTEGGVSDA